jgi:phosphopantetheinyl transferase (holo-ACP synthase)
MVGVIGVGIDLVDLARVARMLADKGDHAFARLFTDEERA